MLFKRKLFLTLTLCAAAFCKEESVVMSINNDELLQQARKSVVNITVMVEDATSSPAENFIRGEGYQGTGFVIAPGRVVTNAHVVGDKTTKNIFITTSSGKEYKADLIGSDDKSDLALLEIPKEAGLVPLKWADSDAVKVGEKVWVVGNPLGFSDTLTQGIVSHKNRVMYTKDTPHIQNWIQTDAGMTFGNSGGPLMNAKGEVLGINSRGRMTIGSSLNFSIPSKIAKNFLLQLEKKKPSKLYYIGLSLGLRLTPEDLKDMHIYTLPEGTKAAFAVNNVEENSPAFEGGLRSGDLITHINNQPVESKGQFFLDIQNSPPEKLLVFKGFSPKGPKIWNVRTDYFFGENKQHIKEAIYEGCLLKELQGKDVKLYGYKGSDAAVVVFKKISNRYFTPGDRILKVDRYKIKNLSHFIDIVKTIKAKEQSKALFTVERPFQNPFHVLISLHPKNN